MTILCVYGFARALPSFANSVVVREHTVEDLSLFETIEIYFMLQHIIYLGEHFMWAFNTH